MNTTDPHPTPDVDTDGGADAPGAQRSPDDRRSGVSHTRAGAWWTGLVMAAVVSVVFLIFIAQNAESVTIAFLGLEGEMSLAVALLLSAAIGALVVALPGVMRIAQLRRALRRANRRTNR